MTMYNDLSFCIDYTFNKFFYSIHFYTPTLKKNSFFDNYTEKTDNNRDFVSKYLLKLEDYYYKRHIIIFKDFSRLQDTRSFTLLSSGETTIQSNNNVFVNNNLYFDVAGNIESFTGQLPTKYTYKIDYNDTIKVTKARSIPKKGDLFFRNALIDRNPIVLGDYFTIRFNANFNFFTLLY